VDAEPLPALYAKWTSEFLGPIPRESRATCDDCAMCARPGSEDEPETEYFNPSTKCCTFLPDIPNFLVGAALKDSDPAGAAGRESLNARIARKEGVTPMGLGPTAVYDSLFKEAPEAFGKSLEMLCPHFLSESSSCGIWRHREATCATWFCKHVRGAVGYEFWNKRLHELLTAIEFDLAKSVTLELLADSNALTALVETGAWKLEADAITLEAIERRADPKSYARIWGPWAGREEAWFIQCSEIVDPLSFADVCARCGPNIQAHLRLTKVSYQRLVSPPAPSRVRPVSLRVLNAGPESTRVGTYNGYDPLDIPNAVLQQLYAFRGRSVDEAVQDIQVRTGMRFEESLVRKLIDFEVLEEESP